MTGSVADKLVEIALNNAELFHAPDGKAFAAVRVAGHVETHAVESTRFRNWVAGEHWNENRKAADPHAIRQALGPLMHLALEGDARDVHVRLAPYREGLVLDLGDASHRVVIVDRTGWRIQDDSPVHFVRAPGMLPLAAPETGGSLDLLREHVTFDSDEDYALQIGWLLGSLRPRGPYLVLVVLGEQGSLKSTTAGKARKLLDPNRAPLRSPPRESRDLAIAAENSRVVALDNLSRLPDRISDDLCSLSTGSGFSVRRLYTDAEETIFAAERPIILGGIDGFATRGDLLDRAVVVTLSKPDRYLPETEVWERFDAAAPKILGALLDAAVAAIANETATEIPGDLRMADACRWVQAAESVCPWAPGTWIRAVQGVREASHREVIDCSPIGSALENMLKSTRTWSGTSTELLSAIASCVDERTKGAREWPRSGRALASELRRIAPAWRGLGHEIRWHREGRDRRRVVVIEAAPQDDGNDRPDRPHRPQEAETLNFDEEILSESADGHEATSDLRPSATVRNTSTHEASNGLEFVRCGCGAATWRPAGSTQCLACEDREVRGA